MSFAAPSQMIEAQAPGEVPAALAALDAARCAGKWLAGYMSYELGYALEERLLPLMPEGRDVPLLRFGVFEGPEPAAPLPAPSEAVFGLRPLMPFEGYQPRFDRLRGYIAAGDIYQANLTFPVEVECDGAAAAVYSALLARQPVGYGALVEQEGAAFVSCSPELFFRTDSRRGIEARPMKGTMARGTTALQDAQNKAWLAGDEKNLAENTMIVDLLRNDLSRVARPGSVSAAPLFEIETYESLFQMTSTVRAALREEVGLSDVIRALYPCGSITGAPKIRAMEILRALEPTARGIYCGSIGWAAPDGTSCFNVAIRTLTMGPKVGSGRARFGVGGGIVWDSRAAAEYEEALWKSRFAGRFQTAPS